MTDFRYPTPTASPFTDIAPYIPLLLAAVEAELDTPAAWSEDDAAVALGYIEDLKIWITELTNP